jgi:hypothetical protein
MPQSTHALSSTAVADDAGSPLGNILVSGHDTMVGPSLWHTLFAEFKCPLQPAHTLLQDVVCIPHARCTSLHLASLYPRVLRSPGPGGSHYLPALALGSAAFLLRYSHVSSQTDHHRFMQARLYLCLRLSSQNRLVPKVF